PQQYGFHAYGSQPNAFGGKLVVNEMTAAEVEQRKAFIELKRREVECREREIAAMEYRAQQEDMKLYLQSYDHLTRKQRLAWDEIRTKIKAKYILKETMMAEQDKISNLPDDVIHCILSFLDMKFVVQTSAMSWKWTNIWTKTIKQPHGFPKVLNVASPQLKNLTASVRAPNMETSCFDILKLSTYDFNCLLNVNLSMSFSYEEKTHVPELLRWFQQLHNTKSLILDMNIVEYRQLRLVLSTEDKGNYLEHPIPAAPVAPPGQQVPPQALAAHAAWVKGQKEVTVLMLLTMDLEIQRNLAHLGAYSMLQELKAMYSKQAEYELLQTVREFHTSK
nr:zinc finger, CCHC-type [Tanacetum cinerariifolium]